MKPFYLAVLILVFLIVIISGLSGTSAWFTDEVILNNSVSTGTLTISITGGPYEGVKLEPGLSVYTPVASFCIRNEGDYNMKWKGWMEQVEDVKNIQNYLTIEAIRNPSGSDGNYGLSNELLFTNQPFSILQANNPYFMVDSPDNPFKPGDIVCYELRGKLSSQAPNDAQNAHISAQLYVFATQQINTGWSE